MCQVRGGNANEGATRTRPEGFHTKVSIIQRKVPTGSPSHNHSPTSGSHPDCSIPPPLHRTSSPSANCDHLVMDKSVGRPEDRGGVNQETVGLPESMAVYSVDPTTPTTNAMDGLVGTPIRAVDARPSPAVAPPSRYSTTITVSAEECPRFSQRRRGKRFLGPAVKFVPDLGMLLATASTTMR